MKRIENKEKTRQAILDSAVRLLKQQGHTMPSVSEVMKGAGLTVGGFYAHFDSKDQLMEQALLQCGDKLRDDLLNDPSPQRLANLVTEYLSVRVRDNPEQGCALPSLGASLTAAHCERLTSLVGGSLEGLGKAIGDELEGDRQAAIALMALLYGGLSLSRALQGHPLADEVLSASRDWALKALGLQGGGDSAPTRQ
jgi:TetR/AcrR family transcriptional repressor of nem operon